MKRLSSLVGPYVFNPGRPFCPLNACRGLRTVNGPEDLWGCKEQEEGRFWASASTLWWAYFLFDSFPLLGISATLIHWGRPGACFKVYIISDVCPQTTSSTGDYVFWGTKNVFCTLNSSRKTSTLYFFPTFHYLLSQAYSATVTQLSKYFAHWQLISHCARLWRGSQGHQAQWHFLRGESMVELGVGEGQTWVLLPVLVRWGGRGRGLGAQGPGLRFCLTHWWAMWSLASCLPSPSLSFPCL